METQWFILTDGCNLEGPLAGAMLKARQIAGPSARIRWFAEGVKSGWRLAESKGSFQRLQRHP